MLKSVEEMLHQFAISYRIESRQTRKEDIALAKKKLLEAVMGVLPTRNLKNIKQLLKKK